MEFLFKTAVIMVGATGHFEVFRDGEVFVCKVTSWKRYQDDGPGEIRIWKEGRSWKNDCKYSQEIPESIVADIETWLSRKK